VATVAGPPGDYPALVARLSAARRFGVRLGLERMDAALDRLGRPERRFLVVQIGGTNGKGSTAAFVAAIARAGGLSVGLYTSPHLSRWSERFAVDGHELGRDELVAAGGEVLAADPAGELTFFELSTLIALVSFARRGVELAVLEVGLGGRLDATTAAAAPIAAVTGVALDHQQHLGDTLAAIAAEKAAIFRPGQRAVIGAAGEVEAVPLLVSAARAAGVAHLALIDAPAIARVPVAPAMAGQHQRRNAACALALIDAVEAVRGAPLPAGAREAGVAEARLPGRLERIDHRGARFLVDGAHNPQAARTVAAALPAGRPRIVVLAVTSDKDAAGVVDPLVAGADHVVVCETRNERAMRRAALAAVVGRRFTGPIDQAGSVAAALDRAAGLAGAEGLVVIAGSLFLAGEAREHLLGEPADEVPLGDPLGPR
jgi:dihydrofolate synthase / folylpolyglutamate synthase